MVPGGADVVDVKGLKRASGSRQTLEAEGLKGGSLDMLARATIYVAPWGLCLRCLEMVNRAVFMVVEGESATTFVRLCLLKGVGCVPPVSKPFSRWAEQLPIISPNDFNIKALA